MCNAVAGMYPKTVESVPHPKIQHKGAKHVKFKSSRFGLVVVVLTALVFGIFTVASAVSAQTLTIVQGTDIESQDVHVVTSSPSYAVLDHIYETLFELSPEADIIYKLATGFDVGADGRTYTLTLRRGVTFSDGTPFNAEAVKANLQRIQDPASQAAYSNLISPIIEMNVLDEYTLQLRSAEPFGPLQVHLAHSGLGMMSPAVLARGNAYVAANPVGTGPFVMEEWRQGEQISIKKRDDYWGEPARVDRVVFRQIVDDGARLVELEAGTADIAIRVPPTEWQRVATSPGLQIDRTPGLRTIYLYFNTNNKPFDDVRVRRAFNHAVNNEAIVTALLAGAGRPSDAPMAPAVFGYSGQTPYEWNPNKARQMLQEAGFDFGQTIVIHHPTGRYPQDALIAAAVQQNLQAIGVNVELRTMEWTTYLDVVRLPVHENEVQIGLLGWGVATMDADYALVEMFHSGQWPAAGFNLGFYRNPLVDAALDRGRNTADADARLAAYAEAQKLIWEDAPWIFLHSELQLTGLRSNVKGFVVHPTERYLAHQAEKE